MPTESISMRKLKEILRLKYQAKLSNRKIAKSLSISAGTVSSYIKRTTLMGLTDWPLPDEWDDIKLNHAFLQTKRSPKTAVALPIWPEFQIELKRKGVTKQLLWQEYVERNSGGNCYSYSQLCRRYKVWASKLQPSMRQNHIAGEKLFIDYCGPTVQIVNPDTGECRGAQIFVAVMGASNYTYAEATLSQKLEDWVMSHVRCFEFLGGVPDLLIPDNLKSATTRACKYDPDLNPTYQQMASHYNVTILPARPLKPKDKAKAENGVLIVERWIMGVIRKEIFYSLTQLNVRIKDLLEWMNNKQFQKISGSRSSLFKEIDQPALRRLPLQSYQYTYIKKVMVHVDYHVEIEKHYYSVPYGLIKQRLEAHVTAKMVKIYHHNNCVAQHLKSTRLGGHSTLSEHMPKSHQEYADWSPERLKNWAETLGSAVLALVSLQLSSKKHPQQSYRACFGLLSLANKYSKERLNAACQRGLDTGAYRLQSIKAILNNGLDKQLLTPESSDQLTSIDHDNVRGEGYYH